MALPNLIDFIETQLHSARAFDKVMNGRRAVVTATERVDEWVTNVSSEGVR